MKKKAVKPNKQALKAEYMRLVRERGRLVSERLATDSASEKGQELEKKQACLNEDIARLEKVLRV